jgi:hypothetical protein
MWVPPLVSDGASIGDLGNALEGDRLGDDPVATWDNAMMHALAAFNTPGAFERTVELSYGPTHARDNARVTALVPTLDHGCSPPVGR